MQTHLFPTIDLKLTFVFFFIQSTTGGLNQVPTLFRFTRMYVKIQKKRSVAFFSVSSFVSLTAPNKICNLFKRLCLQEQPVCSQLKMEEMFETYLKTAIIFVIISCI